MPRKPRLDIPGHLYHIIFRGIEQRLIFRDSADYKEFLRRFGEVLTEEEGICFAWALMPNHAHLLIQSGNNGMVVIMQRLLTGYAVYFNNRHKRVGHLFQNRYRSTLCDKNNYLLILIRYIHLNPLKANIVKNVSELNKYPWTGHSVIAGNKVYPWQDVNLILDLFGNKKETGLKQYFRFIYDGLNSDKDLEGGGLMRSTGESILTKKISGDVIVDERILGDQSFIKKLFNESAIASINTKKQRSSLLFDDFIRNVEEYYHIDAYALRRKNRSNVISIPRTVVAYYGVKKFGKTYLELANFFNMSESSIARMILRFKKIFNENKVKNISDYVFKN